MGALLETVLGQTTAIETLLRGLAARKTHHAYLFEGPSGVGKERAAFGLAQALVCEARTEQGTACGTCSACERAVPLDGALPRHPDVIVLQRGLYDPSQIGRKSPESREISIDQVRTLVLSRSAFPPHEGLAKVFVIRDADELSVSSANALLKTLEEPTSRTHFVLLTARKAALLSTILSRTLALRFGHLASSVVAKILVGRGVEQAAAEAAAELSGGSVEVALALTDPDARSEVESFVARMHEARVSADAGLGYSLAEEGKKGKSELPSLLAGLSISLAKAANDATRAGDFEEAVKSTVRFDLVEQAIVKLRGNGSAQLVMEALVIGLRAT